VRLLRDAFTPYEIARGGLLICWFCFAAGFFVAAVLQRPYAGVMFVLGVLSAIAGHFAASCPGCGKSPMAWYLTDGGERRGGLPMGSRAWPERICSRCRTDLDTH